MKKNMGNLDRVIRLVIAAVLVGLIFADLVEGTLAIILLVVAGVFTLTSFISFCPLYTLLGISSCPKAKR
jgi:hypothetical protein